MDNKAKAAAALAAEQEAEAAAAAMFNAMDRFKQLAEMLRGAVEQLVAQGFSREQAYAIVTHSVVSPRVPE